MRASSSSSSTISSGAATVAFQRVSNVDRDAANDDDDDDDDAALGVEEQGQVESHTPTRPHLHARAEGSSKESYPHV